MTQKEINDVIRGWIECYTKEHSGSTECEVLIALLQNKTLSVFPYSFSSMVGYDHNHERAVKCEVISRLRETGDKSAILVLKQIVTEGEEAAAKISFGDDSTFPYPDEAGPYSDAAIFGREAKRAIKEIEAKK